jgi:hypothetical protein
MKSFIKLALLAIFALLPALVVVSVSAHGSEVHAQEGPTTEEQPATEETTPTNTYNYIAQPGDSHSLLSRKAVQTYGIINSVSLSQAQIIAAETYLTLATGSLVLSQGQAISIEESAVKTAVEKAQTLTEAAQSLWQKYADRANFNTDNVGEVRS